jgi:hypothetical protein
VLAFQLVQVSSSSVNCVVDGSSGSSSGSCDDGVGIRPVASAVGIATRSTVVLAVRAACPVDMPVSSLGLLELVAGVVGLLHDREVVSGYVGFCFCRRSDGGDFFIAGSCLSVCDEEMRIVDGDLWDS